MELKLRMLWIKREIKKPGWDRAFLSLIGKLGGGGGLPSKLNLPVIADGPAST